MRSGYHIRAASSEATLGSGEWFRSNGRHPDCIWIPLGADSTGFRTEGVYMTLGDDQLDGRARRDGSTAAGG